MGRLIRLAFFVAVAFTAGIFAERNNQSERCEAAGGTWQRNGFCAKE
ncbi:hypothetical protein [Cribrihabitans neustonicus]